MKTEGVILAAGLSSRAGAYKMTLEFQHKTIIENVIDNMAAYVESIIVVGGYRIQELEPIVGRYKNVRLVYNQDYRQGMFSSIKKGIGCVTGDRFFITPGDYPLIKPEVYKSMLDVDGEVVIPAYGGRKGHPVLISGCFKGEILQDGKYQNLREFIRTKNVKLVDVNCSGILLDIDTMEDYKELTGISEQ